MKDLKTYGYQERDEQKRREFLEQLEKIDKHRIVYVDEAGFDNQQDYPFGNSPRGQRCYGMKSGNIKKE